MQKRGKRQNMRCEAHEFCLRPRGNYSLQGQNYSVSFCTGRNSRKSKKGGRNDSVVCSECPQFNNDGNYATPSFILPSEKEQYLERGAKIKEDHDQRMQGFTEEQSQLNIPKPRSKHTFCSVCRETYTDYLDHVENIRHRKKVASSKFNSYILEIHDQYNKRMNGDDLQVMSDPPRQSEAESYQRQQLYSSPIYLPELQQHLKQMNFHYNMNVFLNPCLSFVPYNVQASNCYTALDYAHNYHPSAFSQYFSTANQFNINQFQQSYLNAFPQFAYLCQPNTMSNCFPAHDEHRNAEKTVMASTTAPSCLFPSSKTYGYEEPPCRRMTAETINKTQVNSESEEIRCLDGQLNNPKVQQFIVIDDTN